MAIAVGLNPAYSTSTGTAAQTSSAFSPAAGSLIIVTGSCDTGAGAITATCTDSLGSPLTWTQIGTVQTGASGGSTTAFWAFTSSARTNMTATLTWSGAGATNAKGMKVTTWTGTASASAVLAKKQGTSATTNLTVNITTTNNQCRVMGTGTEFNAAGLPTSSDTARAFHTATAIDGISVYKSANSTPAGSTVGINMVAGGAADWTYVIFEIVPAAGGGAASPVPVTRPWQARESRAYWLQKDRRNALLVGAAANPLASPLLGGATLAARTVAATHARPRFPLQPRLGADPSLLTPPAQLDPTLAGVPAVRLQAATQASRRAYPQQFVPRVDQSTPPPVAADPTVAAYLPRMLVTLQPATHADRREVPAQLRTYAAIANVVSVGTGQLMAWWSAEDWSAVQFAQRRGLDPGTPPSGFDPTSAGPVDWPLIEPVTHWRPASRAPMAAPPAPVPTVTTVGTGQLGAWWSADDDRSHLAAQLRVVDLTPFVAAGGTPFDPTLAGSLLGRLQPATHRDRSWRPRQPAVFAAVDQVAIVGAGGMVTWWGDEVDVVHQIATLARPVDPSLLSPAIAADPTMLDLSRSRYWWARPGWTWQFRPVMDQSTPPGVALDPTLAGGLPRLLQLLQAATHVDRRVAGRQLLALDQGQQLQTTDPTTSGGLARLLAGLQPATHADRRQPPRQPQVLTVVSAQALDPTLAGWLLDQVRRIPSTHATRRLYPRQLLVLIDQSSPIVINRGTLTASPRALADVEAALRSVVETGATPRGIADLESALRAVADLQASPRSTPDLEGA